MKRSYRLLSFLLLSAVVAACSGSKDKSTGNNPGAIQGGTTGNQVSGGNGANTFPTGPSLSPTSSYIHYFGRQQTSTPGGVRLSWPGSGVQVRVTGATRITATIQPNQFGEVNVMGVLIDGTFNQKLTLTDNSNVFVINVPSGDHIVTIVKRTEAGNGEVLLANLATDGQFELMPQATGRLIEVIGDNAATGFSADGTPGTTACPPTVNFVADPNTQNAAASFAALSAKAFNADYSIIAYSSRGLVQNYDGSTSITMGDLYPRLDPRDYNSVVSTSPNAQVVIIHLGTNDINYWMTNPNVTNPNVQTLQNGYVALLQSVRKLNPQAQILATAGFTLNNSQCLGASPNNFTCGTNGTTAAQNGLLNTLTQAINGAISASGVSNVTFVSLPNASAQTDYAACYQPSANGHQTIASALIPAIAQATGWVANQPAPAAPAAAARGTGPQQLSGTFVPWSNPLTNPNSAYEQITNKEFPQCHYCSPQPFNANYVGTQACPTLIGTSQPCQSYCHVPDGFIEAYASNPPTSSNHYSTPAVNNAPFTSPKPRGNYIHALEHGAILLAYNCPNDSCPDDVKTLTNIFNQRNVQQGAPQSGTNDSWIILTPDPFLSTKFAIAAWTWLYTPDTLDPNAINCFISQHAYFGRECAPKTPAGCSPLENQPMGSVQG